MLKWTFSFPEEVREHFGGRQFLSVFVLVLVLVDLKPNTKVWEKRSMNSKSTLRESKMLL